MERLHHDALRDEVISRSHDAKYQGINRRPIQLDPTTLVAVEPTAQEAIHRCRGTRCDQRSGRSSEFRRCIAVSGGTYFAGTPSEVPLC